MDMEDMGNESAMEDCQAPATARRPHNGMKACECCGNEGMTAQGDIEVPADMVSDIRPSRPVIVRVISTETVQTIAHGDMNKSQKAIVPAGEATEDWDGSEDSIFHKSESETQKESSS